MTALLRAKSSGRLVVVAYIFSNLSLDTVTREVILSLEPLLCSLD